YTAVVEGDRWGGVTPPAEIAIQGGMHVETGAGAAHVSWHEVSVNELFVDEAMTQPFTGTVFPGDGRAVSASGETYTSLYGGAVESGAPLTMQAFRRGLAPLGDWGHYIVLFGVLLFAVSTAISWSYYGDRCANYLFGHKSVLPYKFVFVLMHFMGAVVPLAVVWAMGDVALAIVIVPNLIALLVLAPQVVEMTRSYFEREPWIENARAHEEWKRTHGKA
ncbi:MAG: alanine:cation symporter family protein, partial [Gemmatimonadota bacterium]|nr:alanine:cation symporter family protein [Gemmatimonadota bacterium]